ncbi:hypothetical protein FH972_025001 [Carpinus fangiana]|uniref:Uncharacterized protein n=1 Tax=Carpinus fangiana TaxID=176857 RepID=A0A5N6KZY1_9ROSI|nr:hypothetical protein FH972_025001 [Carpinus fangiana]
MGGRSLTSRPTGCTRSRPPQPQSHGASGGNRCELAEQAVADVGHVPGVRAAVLPARVVISHLPPRPRLRR